MLLRTSKPTGLFTYPTVMQLGFPRDEEDENDGDDGDDGDDGVPPPLPWWPCNTEYTVF